MDDGSIPRRRQGPNPRTSGGAVVLGAVAAAALAGALLLACSDDGTGPEVEVLERGQEIFRFDTFGDERFWTDTLRMHEVIQAAVTPSVALSVGLKVDVDALPQEIKDALA